MNKRSIARASVLAFLILCLAPLLFSTACAFADNGNTCAYLQLTAASYEDWPSIWPNQLPTDENGKRDTRAYEVWADGKKYQKFLIVVDLQSLSKSGVYYIKVDFNTDPSLQYIGPWGLGVDSEDMNMTELNEKKQGILDLLIFTDGMTEDEIATFIKSLQMNVTYSIKVERDEDGMIIDVGERYQTQIDMSSIKRVPMKEQ